MGNRRWAIRGVMAVLLALNTAQSLHAEPAATGPVGSATLEVKKLQVNGMTCSGCVQAVEAALKGVIGVTQVEVSLKGNEAVVEYDPAQVDPEVLVAAVTESGFEAALKDVNQPEMDADLPESEATQE